MRLLLLALQVSLLSILVAAQSTQPLGPNLDLQKVLNSDAGVKSYSSYEDYCFNNPHAPTCTNGHPLKVQPLPASVFKPADIFGGTKTYRTLAEYCHDNPKSSRCANLQQQIQVPGTGLNLPSNWRFADPHPDALAGINLASLRQSATAKKLLAQISAAMHLDLDQYAGRLDQLGQVEQAWVSISGRDPLFLLQGQMRIPEGFFSLGNGMTSWRISKTAVLIGKEDAVRNAVERLSSAPTAPTAAASSMRELGAQNDFWMNGTAKLAAAQSETLPLSKDITGFTLALALRNGLHVDIRLNCATAASAQKLLAEIRSKQSVAGTSVHLTTAVFGNSFRLGVSVSDRELSDALQSALSGPAGKQLAAIGAAVANSQSKVMIAGGEEGGTAIAKNPGKGSFISNIQGGQLESAPANSAIDTADTTRKPQ